MKKGITIRTSEMDKNGVEIEQEEFKELELELFLCADWKFLAEVLGINAANSRWFCLWCLCQKDEKANANIDWNNYLRTLDNLSGGKCTDENCRQGRGNYHPHGAIDKPLIDTELFDLDHIILDVLHQFLRVMDLMLKHLVQLVTNESPQQEQLLTDACKAVKVTFQKIESKDTGQNGQIIWNSLDGEAQHILLKKLDIDAVLPRNYPKRDNWMTMWYLYDELNQYLQSQNPVQEKLLIQTVEEYELNVSYFLSLVRKLIGKKLLLSLIN